MYGIGATIRIGREIQCLPYEGFFNPMPKVDLPCRSYLLGGTNCMLEQSIFISAMLQWPENIQSKQFKLS